ncbi:NUDIX hydrolase [Coralliovum pocilloporae]|uniref:NUDIX hydrolase n=1 Tax=Coralliovum pocilloporae TaxID=3066369 RepID=UPI00330751DF
MADSKEAILFERAVPAGDTHERDVCVRCGHIAYENPKIVAGSVVQSDDGRYLLCRRAIEPGYGLWTLPAGYLELHESPEAGAMREAREEACADIAILGLLAVYTIPHISQVQLIYRARLESGFSAGEESLDVALFHWDDLPWDDLAFPSVHWALLQARSVDEDGLEPPFQNPAGALGEATLARR